MKQQAMTRKDFLRRLSMPLAACLGVSVMGPGCASAPEKAPAQPKDCDDLSGLTEMERKAREQFGYEKLSAVAERACSGCSLFIVPGKGAACGGCMLFKGPVRPEGSCIQFAAKPA
jgi:hypothetical protein